MCGKSQEHIRINRQNSTKNKITARKTEGKRKWFDKNNDRDVDKYPGSGKTKYVGGIDICRPYIIEWKEYKLPEDAKCYAFPSGDKNDHYGSFKFNYLILEIA